MTIFFGWFEGLVASAYLSELIISITPTVVCFYIKRERERQRERMGGNTLDFDFTIS